MGAEQECEQRFRGQRAQLNSQHPSRETNTQVPGKGCPGTLGCSGPGWTLWSLSRGMTGRPGSLCPLTRRVALGFPQLQDAQAQSHSQASCPRCPILPAAQTAQEGHVLTLLSAHSGSEDGGEGW